MPTSNEAPVLPGQSRRIHRDGRIVILPPDGHGNLWRGSAPTDIPHAARAHAAAVHAGGSDSASA